MLGTNEESHLGCMTPVASDVLDGVGERAKLIEIEEVGGGRSVRIGNPISMIHN